MAVPSAFLYAGSLAFFASTAIRDQESCRAILKPGRDRRALWREAGGQAAVE
ncbi:hypothetical protein I79_011876 [Cricetulus griseus]|uniref:Uncharacterized protein n=1 Tax=Cricetulus griseus TaxID=10029 RepID=G3HMC3_CRIGR|nr:hypothetical protein I79_011876 [Cricetulus griseus]